MKGETPHIEEAPRLLVGWCLMHYSGSEFAEQTISVLKVPWGALMIYR